MRRESAKPPLPTVIERTNVDELDWWDEIRCGDLGGRTCKFGLSATENLSHIQFYECEVRCRCFEFFSSHRDKTFIRQSYNMFSSSSMFQQVYRDEHNRQAKLPEDCFSPFFFIETSENYFIGLWTLWDNFELNRGKHPNAEVPQYSRAPSDCHQLPPARDDPHGRPRLESSKIWLRTSCALSWCSVTFTLFSPSLG
jgi:hypothetical protein